MKFLTILSFCLFGVILSAGAQVQTLTEITGTVSDSQGAAVPGADVTLTNENTGAIQTTTSNATGSYSFMSIPPGTYAVKAAYANFKTAEVIHRSAQVGVPAVVDFKLETGRTTQTVTVSGQGADLLDTTTAEVSGTVNQRLVSSLPLNGRNFLDLATQVPGTSSTGAMGLWRPNGSAQVSFTQSALMGVQVAGLPMTGGLFLGGNRDTSSNISIDGSNIQMALFGQIAQIQSPATIEEVKVETGVMNAEFGFGTGAVNTVTKSGTNQFHGEAYEYLRNNAFDATDYYAKLAGQTSPPYQMNQFGGAVGGPILRDKLHFFANYEGLRINQKNINSRNVPPANLRNGDFSSTENLNPDGSPQPAPTIYNPYKFDPATGLREPFPNNQIPMGNTNLCSPRPTCVDPVTVAYLKYSPLPTTVINGIPMAVTTTPSTVQQNQYTGRIDWDKSQKTHIFGRFTHFKDQSFATNIAPIAGIENPYGSINPTVSWVQTVSSSMVNDVTLAFVRSNFRNSRATNGIGNIAQELGLKNTSDNPGGPDMNVSGYTVVGSNYQILADLEDTLQLKEDLSMTRGRHTFKFGFQAINRRVHIVGQYGDKGQLQYQDVFSAACPQGHAACTAAQQASGLDAGGSSFADYLMGTFVQSSLAIQGQKYNANATYYGGYGQDNWRISSKLNVNLGLRYDYWTPWLEVNRMAAHWDTSTGNVIFALRNPLDYNNPATDYGKNAPLTPGVPGSGYATGKKDFAPRGGVVYLLTPDTTIRAGAGVYFDGNPNMNQVNYMQNHIGPFGLSVANFASASQQSPSLFTDEQFPAPVSGAIGAPSLTNPLSISVLASGYYPTPTIYQWSASMQQRLGSAWAFELTYLGTHTIHELQLVDMNIPNQPLGPLADLTDQQRRQFPGWGRVQSWAPYGFAKYNALIASIKTPRWQGLTFTSWFSWSHDSASGQLGQSDQGNTDFRHSGIWAGPTMLNPSLRQVNTWSYELPVGKGRTFQPGNAFDWIAGGWTFSGTAEFSRGAQQTVGFYPDTSGTDQFFAMPNQTPHCNPNSVPGGRGRRAWINTACYTVPAYGEFGTSHMGSFTVPGVENWNVTLQKVFSIPKLESNHLMFRTDFYNALNHTQWGFVDNFLGDAAFGQIEDTHPPRQIQFALKYLF